MQTLTTGQAVTPNAVVRLQHQWVATLATAKVLRRTGHPRAAGRLRAAADDLAAEIETVQAGGHSRRRVCLVCGCTDLHACPDGCHWVCAPTGVDLCSRCVPLVDPNHVQHGRIDQLLAVVAPDDGGY